MFYPDTPITSTEEDRLGRAAFVKTFVHALLNLHTEDTFSVGLYGEWGCGKTSLVNMALEEMKRQQQKLSPEDQVVIFRFEPWNVSDSSQLLGQFLLQLSNTFTSDKNKKLLEIGKVLENYAEAFELASLIPVVGTAVSLIGKRAATNIGKRLKNGAEQEDIQKQKEHVIEQLKKQSQKILVIIDDIDRLNNEQIRQVFQLMTSVANFPNTIYLVVFDKSIVVKALEKVQEGSGEDYLEKIIQVPIELPVIQNEKIHDIFYEHIDEVIAQNEEISFQPDHWHELFKYCIDPFIRSLRDINRLCNSVQFKLAGIGAEVDFTDMIAITGLELKLPRVYNWVKNNKPILTEEFYSLNSGMQSNKKPTPKELYKRYNDELEELCDENNLKKEYEVEMVITFLSKLFPCFGQKIGKNYTVFDKDTGRRDNQIAHPEKFDRYFDLDLDNIGIKKAEVLKTVNSMDVDNLRTYILDCDKKGKCCELLEEIRAIRSLLPLPRVKVLAQGVLDTLPGLNATKQNEVFARDASRLAINLIIELVDLFPEPERFDFLGKVITNADAASFSSVTQVVYLMGLEYERSTADGKEGDCKKIMSAKEWDEVETMFVQKVQSLLQEQSLFDIPNWLTIFPLLEHLAPEYFLDYLSEAFQDNSNVLKYLGATIGTCYGKSIRYEVRNDYQKYITEDQILEAVEATKKSRELFSLPGQVQSMSAAFYLNHYEHEKFPDVIMQADVNELLSSWEDDAIRN